MKLHIFFCLVHLLIKGIVDKVEQPFAQIDHLPESKCRSFRLCGQTFGRFSFVQRIISLWFIGVEWLLHMQGGGMRRSGGYVDWRQRSRWTIRQVNKSETYDSLYEFGEQSDCFENTVWAQGASSFEKQSIGGAAKQENQQVACTSGEIALDVESLPCANGCSETLSQTLPFESVPLTGKAGHIQPYKQEMWIIWKCQSSCWKLWHLLFILRLSSSLR